MEDLMKYSYSVNTKEISGYKIEYAEVGPIEKPVLIFAHGLGGNLRQWNEQFTFFTKDYRVIAFSLQGHGNSSIPKTKDACSIEHYGDVVLALLKELEINSCIWIGNSMGGVIGYEILKRRPELIQHLITNGTAPALKYNKAVLKVIRFVDRILIGLLGYERYVGIAVNASLKDSDKRKDLKKLFMSCNPLTIIESHQLLGDYNYLDVIEKSQALITFILTPRDKDINKAINIHRQRLFAMSNVTCIEKKQGGHVYNIEFPEDYNRMLKSIFNKGH